MIPKTLSASSVVCYESCPARWKAEWLERVPSPSGSAATLGTICHAFAERWVKEGWYEKHLSETEAQEVLIRIYNEEFVKRSSDASRQEEGLDLCRTWVARQDWTGRTVLSTEIKKSFMIPTSKGKIRFNYIMDRMDRRDDGVIEAWDYKTSSWPIGPEDMRYKVQAQAYALAAQIEFPEAPGVWVFFDLMRFDPVGTYFTRDDNAKTWYYLKDLAERMLADEKAPERLNDTCRFCVRRFKCETLTKHAAGGGSLALDDPIAAVDQRAALHGAQGALKSMVEELDAFLLASMERNDMDALVTEQTCVKVSTKKLKTGGRGKPYIQTSPVKG